MLYQSQNQKRNLKLKIIKNIRMKQSVIVQYIAKRWGTNY